MKLLKSSLQVSVEKHQREILVRVGESSILIDLNEYVSSVIDNIQNWGSVDLRPFFLFALSKPGDLRAEARIYDAVTKALAADGLEVVVEMFGGFGVTTSLIQTNLRPEIHRAIDLDPFCISCLSRNFPGVSSICGDTFKLGQQLLPADLVSFDFNSFSVLRLERDRKVFGLLASTFETQPQCVILVDSAINKLHINGPRKRYFNTIVTSPEQYWELLSKRFQELFNFSIDTVLFHFGAAYLIMSRGRRRLKEVIQYWDGWT